MGNKTSRGGDSADSNKDSRNNKRVPEDKEALSAAETTDMDNISDITCIKPYVPEISFGDYNFPFENLVFEGGGNKALAFCGAVRVGVMIFFFIECRLITVSMIVTEYDWAVMSCIVRILCTMYYIFLLLKFI